MDPITIDGLHEDAFRATIEDQLRRGHADTAAQRLRALIEPYSGDHALFPARFVQVSHEDIEISGWDRLEQGFAKFDRAERPVSAICLSFGDPEGSPQGPDEAGLLTLTVETSYFSDEAFPFSESDRNDLLDGYTSFGCQWAGDCEGVDHALSFRGIDDLHGALAALERRLLATEHPDPDEIRAGTIASCYLSVLFHQALRDTAGQRQLGRPLCITTANNGVYPSFDAPVLSCDEYLARGNVVPIAQVQMPMISDDENVAHAHVSEDEDGVETSEEGSLLSIGIRRTAKQPVLALAEGDAGANEAMQAMASAALDGMAIPPPSPPPPEQPAPFWHDEPVEAEALSDQHDVFADPASFVEIAAESEPEPRWQVCDDAAAAPDWHEAPEPPADFKPAEWEPEFPVRAGEEITPAPQMGDTEWPLREEEPVPQAVEAIAPVPWAEVAPRAVEHNGHNLRARLTVMADEAEPTSSLFSRLIGLLLRFFSR